MVRHQFCGRRAAALAHRIGLRCGGQVAGGGGGSGAAAELARAQHFQIYGGNQRAANRIRAQAHERQGRRAGTPTQRHCQLLTLHPVAGALLGQPKHVESHGQQTHRRASADAWLARAHLWAQPPQRRPQRPRDEVPPSRARLPLRAMGRLARLHLRLASARLGRAGPGGQRGQESRAGHLQRRLGQAPLVSQRALSIDHV
mmetsp:Transcript_2830/g.10265  ORF Transcript_2830/g.10265 Transcript_2830/m.10265 type:complete len:201 (+) Transcript_2830:2306-2908(+)